MNEQVVLGYAERDGGGVGFAWLVYTWEIQFSSVTQLCLTLCNPMDYSMPGFPVHHQLLELAQIRSIQLVIPSNYLILCHPLLLLPLIFPSNRVFSNELAFASGGQSFGASASALVLLINIQGWFPLGLTGLISFQSKWFLRIFPAPSQFTSLNSSVLSLLYGPTLTSIHDYS